MRGIGALGFVALAFGLASYQVLSEWTAFSIANTAAGTGLVAVAAVAALRRWQQQQNAADTGPVRDAILMVVAIAWGAILVQVLASHSGVRLDWTFEQRYALAPATEKVLRELGDRVTLTLYYEEGDPRRRASRLLLEGMAQIAGATTAERNLDESPDEEDFYGIGSSNSVVLAFGDRWELADRPTEGALYEAMSALVTPRSHVVYATTGTGEGDLARTDDIGFSGLRAALETEGYEVRPLPTAAAAAVPPDADAVLVIAPRRQLSEAALAALRDYARAGGSLIAFLEPGVTSGMEALLAEFGMTSPNAIIIDPSSGPIEGDAAGLNPIASSYADHPAVAGLNRNRMTFFRRARTFLLRKPQPNDKLEPVVYSGRGSWLYDDLEALHRHTTPEKPVGVHTAYYPIAVTGRYDRDGHRTRIVAFGDSDFASNRYLRSLYNLDLMLNAVHWAVAREPAITLRPKIGSLLQFPVPLQRSLSALYGVGLIVPQLIVMIGTWVWIRRRSA